MLRSIIKRNFFKDCIFCIASSLLLTLAFPKTDFGFLAWIALIPWMMALDGKRKLPAFGFSYLAGIIFFSCMFYWFIHVTLPGLIFLILYLAVYFGAFGVFYVVFSRHRFLKKIFLLSSAWVVLEFLRARLFSGFGWASLGHSQYKNLPLIQIADITGVLGISFIVVMVNVFLKEYFEASLARKKWDWLFLKSAPARVVGVLLFICYGYGAYRLNTVISPPTAKIAVVQANIEQEIKWDPREWRDIFKKYLKLTKNAAAEKPELIIWPETSFPGYVWEAPELFEDLRKFTAEIKTPLLIGMVRQLEEDVYYNSAVLLSSDGEIVETHNKLHLVPFGEYIPLRNILPFLEAIVPIGDFTAGTKYTLFPVDPGRGKGQTFGVLICFEDTVSRISRAFTQRGADLLVNITNNAWFKDTKAPYLHMQDALFRTVENRRALVRSTNTGISCVIDPYGRVLNYVENGHHKKTYVEGHILSSVPLGGFLTFYTKYGDIFTYFCLGSILWGIVRRV